MAAYLREALRPLEIWPVRPLPSAGPLAGHAGDDAVGPHRQGRPARRRPPRICSSWSRAAICWATRAAWMPWNRPSSQPTSWAWAIRSSGSLGGVSPSNGSDSRSSSSRSSGARPSSSSMMERWWISRSRPRLASSSGAARTSSSSCLIMLPIRITLAGCSIRLPGSSGLRLPSVSTVPIGRPSGPTTMTEPSSCWSAVRVSSVMRSIFPHRPSAGPADPCHGA